MKTDPELLTKMRSTAVSREKTPLRKEGREFIKYQPDVNALFQLLHRVDALK